MVVRGAGVCVWGGCLCMKEERKVELRLLNQGFLVADLWKVVGHGAPMGATRQWRS